MSQENYPSKPSFAEIEIAKELSIERFKRIEQSNELQKLLYEVATQYWQDTEIKKEVMDAIQKIREQDRLL